MAQMIFSVMPAGRMKGEGLPPVNCGTANCMNWDQIGAAPLKPVVFCIGV